jgi:D-amino-acid oxidase
MRVIVVGAGVIGLSCAVRLAEAGYEVAVLARDLPLETTSAVAAAIWYPYLAAPQEKVTRWGRASYDEFLRLSRDETSIRVRNGFEYLPRPTPDPPWAAAVPDLHRVPAPVGFADGWSFTTPVVETPRYLPYLAKRLENAGATITRAALHALPNNADVVVNCTGLGARRMAGDDSLTPVRGQIVRVAQPAEPITDWLIADRGDGGEIIYVVPREHDVVVGGTSQPGNWSRSPDPATAERIMSRAAELVPPLAKAEILAHRVGLRPGRAAVRCDASEINGRLLVHCYGHGGAGVTLSWGCADDVLELVSTAT